MITFETHKLPQGRILDFDIEARPASYWVPDRPTAQITAIAACFVGDLASMQVWLLGRESIEEILERFVEMYDQASLVTGHYITRYDLPQINGHLIENGMAQLSPKMAQDTKTQYVKRGDQPATQEYLAELLNIPAPKVQMSQGKWREANRLSDSGMKLTEKRVMGDVIQHMLLRKKMIELNLLRGPVVWRP